MLSREDVIGIVAKEHGILISRDDPILTLLAVHQVMINEYAQTLGSEAETANQSLTQSLLDAQTSYKEQAKELANQVVGKAVNEFAAAEKRLAQELKQFELARNPYEARLKRLEARFTRIEMWLLCCAVLSLGCLIVGVVK